MIARATPCDRELLRQVLREAGDTVHQRQLEDHLTTCDLCRHELERLAGGDDWLFEVREHLSSAEVLPYHSDSHRGHQQNNGQHNTTGHNGIDPVDDDRDGRLDFLEPSTDPTKLGRLGTYEIESVIGRGGMGIVLKAFDSALNRHVAIKVLAAELATSGAARRRFARESQAAAAIAHEHVVAIHAVDNSGKLPFLVMPYIPGKSLQERLDESGPLEIKEILRISLQAAAGLAAAHAQGLVHRDIKPANILLENGIERVRITDFGLARAVDDASQTQSGFIAGTPQYMAPEQARGEPLDHRADLFSLGSVMYAMCTGRPPFRAETTLAVLRRICEETPRPVREINPEVPDWLQAVIEKLHARDPAKRFQTAAEVSELLEQYLAHVQQPATCPRPRFQRSRSEWRGRLHRWRLWLAASGATVAVAAALLSIYYQTNLAVVDTRPTGNQVSSVSTFKSNATESVTNVGMSAPPMMSGTPQAPVKIRSTAPVTTSRVDPWQEWDTDMAVVADDVLRLEQAASVRLPSGSPLDQQVEVQDMSRQLDAVEKELRK